MKNIKYFKIIFKYLKKDKFKLFMYVILNVIKTCENLFNTFIWAYAIDALIKGNFKGFTYGLLLYFVIKVLIWVFVSLFSSFIYNGLEKTFMKNVNKDLYKKISDLPAIAFEDYSVGEFVNRMYTDPEMILSLLNKLIVLSIRLINAIIMVIITFTITPKVGIELIIFGIIIFILSHFYFPKVKKLQENVKNKSDEYVKIITQNISGIREIKGLGIKKNTFKRVNSIIDNLFSTKKNINNYENLYYVICNFIYFLFELIIIYSLGLRVNDGLILYASFVLIEGYIWRVGDVIERLSEIGITYNKVSVSLKRIDEIVSDKLYKSVKFGNEKLNADKCSVSFKNVMFKYKKEDKDYILKDLSMFITPNKKIAIVGKSGQGKTTIFNLLLRYFDSTKGNIYINDINIKDLDEESLRNNISVIRQQPYLFNQTILENLKVVDDNLTLEEIRTACKKAYIDDYIMSLPNKYDTLIGEGGINLSGGQKQRLAIARTLLKDTKIILFDEATSALDNESQEYIKKTIDDLVKDHTIIIVAHRLSTIMDADKIFLIDDGKVLDSGNHEQLMKKSKLYKKLYTPEVLDF